MYLVIQRIKKKLRITWFKLLYKHEFARFGSHSFVYRPMRITPGCISFGDHVQINDFSRIEGVYKYDKRKFSPEIIFHSFVTAQQGLHLTCASRIEIGKDTAIAANVTITDINHPYTDISKAPEYQPIEVDEVYIGESCKIYNNAVILPGARLGKHSVVAANSVVPKGDYGDYVVLGGSPAKILKKYDFEYNEWRRV